jgi:hypothetical protein
MAIRCLSGMIKVPQGGSRVGTVTIGFLPFAFTAAPANFELRKRRQFGPQTRFVRVPCSIVAARQFAHLFPLPHHTSYRGRINDVVTRDSITISWTTSASEGRVDQEEIPFLVIGEVGELVPIPPGFPGSTRPNGPPSSLQAQRARKRRGRTTRKGSKKKRR